MDSKQTFGAAKLEYIPMSALKVHPKVQRAYDPPWAKMISEHWDPLQCEPLACVKGKVNGTYNGVYLVIEGQHRLGAARLHYGEVDQMLPCMIYPDLEQEEQAKVWLGFNNKKAANAISKWQVRRLAKDETVLAIDALLKERGLRISSTGGSGCIRAVSALASIYAKPGPEALDQTLQILKGAWGDDVDAFDQLLLRGVSTVVAKFGGAISHRDLATKLARYGPPARMIGEARQLGKLSGISTSRALAEIVVNTWNKNKREDSKLTF